LRTAKEQGKDRRVTGTRPLDGKPEALVRAATSRDVVAIAEFQTKCWREA
jgi:hypothetical protein